jgi:hypothetical protein
VLGQVNPMQLGMTGMSGMAGMTGMPGMMGMSGMGQPGMMGTPGMGIPGMGMMGGSPLTGMADVGALNQLLVMSEMMNNMAMQMLHVVMQMTAAQAQSTMQSFMAQMQTQQQNMSQTLNAYMNGAAGGGAAGALTGGGVTNAGPVAQGTAGMLAHANQMVGLHENRNTAAINQVTKKSGINCATTPWCAAWAMNLLKDHGVLNLDGLSNRNYCPTIKSWGQKKGIWGNSGQYTPKAGDAILFDWDKDGTTDHIGIVEKVANGKVYTIEGNSSNSVKKNTYALNSNSIDGYLRT